MIIDELRSSFSGPESPVAFFYFDYQDQDHQTTSSILSSILRQIVATMPKIPKRMTDAYEKLSSSGVSLPLHEPEKLMFDITGNIERTYIIIDALDECDESRYRRTFLQFIDRLKQIQTVRLYLTSRHYPLDINAAFHTHPQIAVQAHDSDLRRYMYQELDHAGVDDIIDDIFATKIVEAVISRAQGM
jgi:ankyrin repeat domain-containing protein 50